MTDSDVKSLQVRVSRAGVFVAVRQLLVRIVTILQLIILAKILSPTDFGLFAIAMMVYAFVESMTFLGFGQALIQRDSVTDEDLNTLFFVNIARGTLLSLTVLAFSKPISWFMNSVESWSMIAAIGLLPLVGGLHNPAMILLQKNLRMEREIIFYISGALSNLIVSVLLSQRGFGPWALLIGLITQSIVQLASSYLICSFRPSMQFSRNSFDDMFNFGKWLLASQSLKYFSNNLPSWIIGNYLGLQSLGIYHVAGKFSQAIGSEFASLISTVAFPAFSKIAEDSKRLAHAYLRSQKIVHAASFLIFGIIIALSTPFSNLFFDSKWVGIEKIIALLALHGAIQSIGSQAEIFKALNFTKAVAKFSFVRLAIVILVILYLVKTWGMVGAVISILVPSVVTLIPAIVLISKELKFNAIDFWHTIAAPLTAFLVISFTGLCLHPFEVKTYEMLFISAGLYFFVYVFLVIAIDFFLQSGIFEEWKSMLNRFIRFNFRS